MTIRITNSEAELKSFPSSQSIYLLSSEELEDKSFEDNIVLFRLQTENQLINLSEPYSYNLGFIKETFDRVNLTFITSKIGDDYSIQCKPKELLNLDSTYCLSINKTLSSKFLTLTKNNSKSNSNINVKLKDNFNIKSQSILKIVETSFITGSKNIANLLFDGRAITLDVRSKNKILSNNVEVTLEDTIYVKDEEFIIDIDPHTEQEEDLLAYIHTVNSKSINPIPKEEVPNRVSNLDIINYYNTLNKTEVIKIERSIPKYLRSNVFSIKLPEGYKIKKDGTFKATVSLVFNNYLLEQLKLYDSSKKYICVISVDDFDNEVIIEVSYTNNPLQIEPVVFDLTNLED